MTTSNAELLRAITDLHNTVGDARRDIGRLEGKLDPVIEQITGPEGLEVRVRKVEHGQHKVGSIYGLAGGLLSFVGIKIFGGH